MIEIANEIERVLKEGNFKKGIDLMRDWLAKCELGEPRRLLEACSLKMRPNVTLLMRDLLSCYPVTLLGCPLLIFATKGSDSPLLTNNMALPFPSLENVKPSSDLKFIGWLPYEAQIPIRFPLQSTQHTPAVDWCKPTACVALFRTHSGVLDLDEVVAPSPEWWGEVFIDGTSNDQNSGDVRIEGNMLLNYPDALEVATSMQAGAWGNPPPARGSFQSELSWAYELGIVFRENCRIQFIDSEF